MAYFDPPLMPRTGERPAERLARGIAVAGTAGEAYLSRRAIPLAVAEAAGVRFDPDLAGRAALIVALKDRAGEPAALHGRYLRVRRGENKMFTFGAAGGAVQMPGWGEGEALILVEGLFDALSLAACGWPCIATVGRWAPWLAEEAKGRVVWLAFDAGRPGEEQVLLYTRRLPGCRLRRLLPPQRCKDWNTALVKRGPAIVTRWLRDRIATGLGHLQGRRSEEEAW